MRDLDLEVFLAVYRHKSFSKAAAQMFMSQSSISERLKALENTLGYALLQRNRGNREITLTPEGRIFYELAKQRKEITRAMFAVREVEQTIKLRIGCLNSIGIYLCPHVWQRFSQKYPHSKLEFYSMLGRTAYKKIADREIDLAFSTIGDPLGQVTATPFVSEPMVFICSADSDYPDVVERNMLSVQNELYRRWSYNFERWHHSFFRIASSPIVQTDFFGGFWSCAGKHPNTWSIVPRSVATGICDSLNIRQCQTAFSIPDRMLFSHTFFDTVQNDHIQLFLQCFREVLQEQGTGLLL